MIIGRQASIQTGMREAMTDAPSRLRLERALLPGGWADDVVVSIRDGRYEEVVPEAGGNGVETVRGIAVPGMTNLHSHAFQRGMAGLAERRSAHHDSFWTWRETMYAFLSRLSPDDVEAIAAQGYVEMLEAGFTAVGEFHYLHHQPDGAPYDDPAEMAGRIAAAAGETGIGLTLLPVYYAQGGFGGAPPAGEQRRFVCDLDLFERLKAASGKAIRGLPGARLGVAPHSLRAVTPEDLAALLSAHPDGPIHIHAAEQVREVEDCLAWSGERPIEWLLEHASLDTRWTVIHATHMSQQEVEDLAASGAIAGLCPVTEASLGDGIFDGVEYLEAGGRFGIGTDSNIRISLAGELSTLEYGQRLRDRARNRLAPRTGSTGRQIYDTALAGGSQALRRDMGAIAPGRQADLVILDPDHPALVAAYGDAVLDAWIFAGGNDCVSEVWVGGLQLVREGRHLAREAVMRRYGETMRWIMA
jgi:formimidoylglutamate deiminase